MKILAVESSCDETSAAVVENGRQVLSSLISSQVDFHAKYGGVIPEMAARQHLEKVNYVIQDALDQAGLTLKDVDAFAGTLGPGLAGALLVGANAAKTLSFIEKKPFLGVNHLYGHVASNYLESDLEPPFVCLLISGGHTQILHVADYADIRLVGQTLDDAVGEAYDKVARMIGLPYPGGPALDKLAREGDAAVFKLPTARTERTYDFSYSGLKTAALRLFQKEAGQAADPEAFRRNLAASFQETATAVLVRKTVAAAEALGLNTIAVAGGVAANSAVREKFHDAVDSRSGWRLFIPPMKFCTDNAAMIAASAYLNPITTDIAEEVFSSFRPEQAVTA